MRPALRIAWQCTIGVLIALSLFLQLRLLVDVRGSGEFGFTLGGGYRDAMLVQTVTPGLPAANAGVKPGEWIYLEPSLQARVTAYMARPGERLSMRAGRPDGPLVELVSVDAPPPPAALVAVIVVTGLSFLLIAGLVAWRRSQDPAARALATFLAAFGLGLSLGNNVLPGASLRFASLVAAETSFLIGIASVLAFACRFPAPKPGGVRERIGRAIPAIAALGLALSLARLISMFVFGAGDLTRPLLTAFTGWYAIVMALTIGIFIASYRSASGADRVRLLWILATFATGFSGLAMLFATVALGVREQWSQYCALTVCLIPFGLGYTILRHRVLDIGFVVNRAVVYTAVSFVVIGAFIAFEWLLGHLVEQGSKASTALQFGAALVLGLSVRFIHARVDRYVDDIFFSERHAAEAAMRKFAREAGLITTPEELVQKTVEVAQSRARLSGCAFYAKQDGAYAPLQSTIPDAGAVGENDYAVLDMRAWHAAVDLHGRESGLAGELALPMMVRGTLSGFLLCAAKVTSETFAPDERDALGVLARDAGIALDSLRVRIIERELAFLAADGELPPELRARLNALVARSGDEEAR